jgi:AcrR family transcriptional regulator
VVSRATEAATSQRILAAAEALFAEHGFRGTTIQMVADAAGVNRALIFYYYGSKERLYQTLMEEASRALGEEMKLRLQRVRDPVEALQAWIEVASQAMASRPQLLRLVLREVVGPGARVLPVERYIDELEAPLRSTLEEGVRQGLFRPLDSRLTAIGIFGLLSTYFRRRFATGEIFSAEEVSRHVLDLILHGLLSGPRHNSVHQI